MADGAASTKVVPVSDEEIWLDKYDEEFWLGLFSWALVPLLVGWALVVSSGIAVKHFGRLVDDILERFREGGDR